MKPYEPLFFTCEVYKTALLRVVLPTGDQEIISAGDTAANVALPIGFMAVSLNIIEIDGSTRTFKVTLSIDSASLLNGGEIKCDDTTSRKEAKANCPVIRGELSSLFIVPNHSYNVISVQHIYIMQSPQITRSDSFNINPFTTVYLCKYMAVLVQIYGFTISQDTKHDFYDASYSNNPSRVLLPGFLCFFDNPFVSPFNSQIFLDASPHVIDAQMTYINVTFYLQKRQQ